MTEVFLPELTRDLPGKDIQIGDQGGRPLVIDRTHLGSAIDPFTGLIYRVVATRHDKDWPGTDSPVTFAVERQNHKGQQDYSVGFFSELECWQYLTRMGWIEVEYPDSDGRMIRDRRKCLGIPDAYVRKG